MHCSDAVINLLTMGRFFLQICRTDCSAVSKRWRTSARYTVYSKVIFSGYAMYWESRPSQHLDNPHDWRPLHNTQMYAISPSYDFTWSFKHVARCVKLRQRLRTQNHLRKILDRAEWNLLKTLVKEATSGTVVRALMTDYSKADLCMELDCSLRRE
jgi:hypothetical protein